MKIPVLTYHSHQIGGMSYATNDHVALAADLRAADQLGFQVVPLLAIAEWAVGERTFHDDRPLVGVSFDDGTDFDYRDLDHPQWGLQQSFAGVLRDFRAECGTQRQPTVHATSFVVASAQARARIDRDCMADAGWWSDDWWADATAEGVLAIGSHGWDHNHPALPDEPGRPGRGRFDVFDNYADCAHQIEQASDYIEARTGGNRPALFAYPWGQRSSYTLTTYLPDHGEEHQLYAAFGCGKPEWVLRGSQRWDLPRFVCGSDWKTPSALRRRILEPALA